ncbi:uncharacterized protein EAE98_008851 [Botrytis deweyae]|uniref:Uncharacterized protein n=1 Tax=Botrytis deweyae TaxID=2478750 RepID=A0ABQ7IDM3_9HELO|nr:uncharacterized protein EAE98_008851 [Botrytis deweyae]KAF7920822.1 hypothetical protein EAE98_008851 [Botrytis deweyae]
MDLLPSFSSEEELSEAEKRIQKASISEIVNKHGVCSSALVATPDLAGLLYLYDGQEEKTKLETQRLPDEAYSAILTTGGLREAE